MSLYAVTVAGRTYTVRALARRGSVITFEIEGQEYSSVIKPHTQVASAPVTVAPILDERESTTTSSARATAQSEVKAPLPGIISDMKVKVGDTISAGATLLVIEAMKMENPIKAPRDGVIKTVEVKKGQDVQHGALLITLE
jgi:biotin carboxyl carrier protein